ncbi:outer membrane protein assembly factor BamA [bacterium]|nr:outer membrane protein assembly factor BamA [candidate division CSSED10-310 bacterium]
MAFKVHKLSRLCDDVDDAITILDRGGFILLKTSSYISFRIAFIVTAILYYSVCYGQNSPLITTIEITGNLQIEKETILYLMESKPGKPVDVNVIRRDIKKLYATDFFNDVTVYYEKDNGGVRIIVEVAERPIITEILISGAKEIQMSTLMDEITVKKGERYNPVTVTESINKISAKYAEKGYNYALITPRLSGAEPGSAALVFSIDEGTKVRIEEIRFEGNTAFSDGNRFWGLKSKFDENKEHWWMSWLTSSGKLKEDKLNEDLKKIEEFYKDRGYLKATVGKPKITVSKPEKAKKKKKAKQQVIITIPIEEGDVYTIGEVDAKVDEASIYPAEVIKNVVKATRLEKYQKFFGGSAFFKAGPRLEKGKIYSYSVEQEAITQINELYGMLGYIYAMIEPVKTIHEDSKTVDITFTVTQGQQAFLHRLEFIGNNRTRDRVLRRNFTLAEGDIFNTAAVKQSISRIQYLGYIDEVKPEIIPQTDMSQVDVNVSVNDTKQTEIQLAGGYSAYENFYGTIGLSEHNLFGRGQEFNFSATSGKRRETFSLSFTDEWIFDRPYFGSASIWKTTRDYDYSQQESLGGSLTTGRALKYNLSTRLGYKMEVNRVFDVEESADEDIKDIEGRQVTSSVTSTWIHDKLNNQRDPSKGTYTRFSVEYAGSTLGGDNDFYKTNFSFSYFKPLPKNLVFGFSSEFNFAEGLRGKKLPFYERYLLGGPRSVRGYTERSIGPWDEYGQNLGGNKAVRLSAEIQIPIAGPLKTILFADAGDAYAEQESVDLRSLRPSIGFEVRFYVPGFWIPLRFIWGYNLDPLETEDKNDFQFTMGTVF